MKKAGKRSRRRGNQAEEVQKRGTGQKWELVHRKGVMARRFPTEKIGGSRNRRKSVAEFVQRVFAGVVIRLTKVLEVKVLIARVLMATKGFLRGFRQEGWGSHCSMKFCNLKVKHPVAVFLLAPEFAAFSGFANPVGRPTQTAKVGSRRLRLIWEILVGKKGEARSNPVPR